jgi:hypothetical protein
LSPPNQLQAATPRTEPVTTRAVARRLYFMICSPFHMDGQNLG